MAWVGRRSGRASATTSRRVRSSRVGPRGGRRAARPRAPRRAAPTSSSRYEPGGGYGHPDHVRAHEVTQWAVDFAASRADGASPAFAVPVVLWAVQGRLALQRGLRALGGDAVAAALGSLRDDLELPDPTAELPSVAVPDDEIDLEVDVLPVRDRVLAALRAHATQVQAVRGRRRRARARRLLRAEQPRARPGAAHRVVPSSATGGTRCGRRLAGRRPPGSLTRVQRLSAGAIGARRPAPSLLGVVVGALGTVMHRSIQPWGLVVCLLLALAAAVTARAWGGLGRARRATRGGLFVSVQVLAQPGPGRRRPRPGRSGDRLGVGARCARVSRSLAGVLPTALFDDRPPRTPGPPRHRR